MSVEVEQTPAKTTSTWKPILSGAIFLNSAIIKGRYVTKTLVIKSKDVLYSTAMHICYGDQQESPKVIISNANILLMLQKCSIHILPIVAAVIFTVLNMNTYSMGDIYPGGTTPSWQDFDKWGMQIAAKVYVSSLIKKCHLIMLMFIPM